MKNQLLLLFFCCSSAITFAQEKKIKWEKKFEYEIKDGKIDSTFALKNFTKYNQKGSIIQFTEYCRLGKHCEEKDSFSIKRCYVYDSLDRETELQFFNPQDSIYEEKEMYFYFTDINARLIKKQTLHYGHSIRSKTIEFLFYNDKGLLSQTVDSLIYPKDTSVITCFYVYDKNGNLIEENDDKLNPFGIKTRYKFDKNNRQISFDDESYGCGNRVTAYRYKYDKKGNKIQKKSKFRNVWSIHDFTYNDKNQLISEETYSEKYPEKLKTNYSYNENDVLIKEESYDRDGDLKSITIYEYGYF